MVQVLLNESQFTNNKFIFTYGNREALFTIVDEEFAGHNQLGRINQMTILVRKTDSNEAQFCTTVIGVGDGTVLIKCEDKSLRGKLMTKDNMHLCVVELFEDYDT